MLILVFVFLPIRFDVVFLYAPCPRYGGSAVNLFLKTDELRNEILVMSQLNHPNICRLLEIYESPTRWGVVVAAAATMLPLPLCCCCRRCFELLQLSMCVVVRGGGC